MRSMDGEDVVESLQYELLMAPVFDGLKETSPKVTRSRGGSK